MRGESPLTVLEARTIRAEPPVSEYAAELVRGVQAHRDEIDRLLAENSRGWTLDRMPAVDRNILRIGSYELLWGTQVPEAVAISEAVLLAGDLSTDASPAFVNGLLARLLELKPRLSEEYGISDTSEVSEASEASQTAAAPMPPPGATAEDS